MDRMAMFVKLEQKTGEIVSIFDEEKMTNFYWINANISGAKKWHLVLDKKPGLFFIKEDFEEEYYDIDAYREDFPENQIIRVPNVHEIKNPLGICDEHAKIWERIDCPLCDALFLYDRLKLALDIMGESVCLLSETPEIFPGIDDDEKDEENRGKVCKLLTKFLDYAKLGMTGETCSCDEIGESRCPKHGLELLMDELRKVKK